MLFWCAFLLIMAPDEWYHEELEAAWLVDQSNIILWVHLLMPRRLFRPSREMVCAGICAVNDVK